MFSVPVVCRSCYCYYDMLLFFLFLLFLCVSLSVFPVVFALFLGPSTWIRNLCLHHGYSLRINWNICLLHTSQRLPEAYSVSVGAHCCAMLRPKPATEIGTEHNRTIYNSKGSQPFLASLICNGFGHAQRFFSKVKKCVGKIVFQRILSRSWQKFGGNFLRLPTFWMAIFLKNNIGHWRSILFCFLLSDRWRFPQILLAVTDQDILRIKAGAQQGPSGGRSILPKPFPSLFPGQKKTKMLF